MESRMREIRMLRLRNATASQVGLMKGKSRHAPQKLLFGGYIAEGSPKGAQACARLGNFCVDFAGSESWLVTAEWMQPLGCEKYGSDNSIWLIRAK